MLALLALVLAGCGKKAAAPAGSAKGAAAPVIVGQVHRKVVPLVIDAIGAVEPIRTTSVRSQVTGVVTKIAIQEGQDVKEGDLLIQIDPRPFQNALDSANADRERIAVQLENARAQVKRYQTLNAEAMVSKEQFQKIQDDERALSAQALAADSAVANAKLQLEYASIRAPIAGRTGNLNVHEGDLIRVGESGFLVSINQLSPIYVTFGVPQQHLTALNRYRAAGTLEINAAPPGGDAQPEKGQLTFVDNIVDSTTGTLKLKGTFPNGSQRLWPGQFAMVNVTLAAPEVLVVASSAIQTSQTGQHVFVVKPDNTAELRPVTVERTLGSDAVIAQGLADGETVVTDGQLRVLPGRPVEIKTPDVFTGGSGNAAPAEGAAKAAPAKSTKSETKGKQT